MSIFWYILGGGCLLAVSRAAAAQAHPVRSVLGCAFFGMAALGLVNALGSYTGVTLPLSWLTAFVSVVLGAPGVVSLLLLQLLL